MPAVADDDAGMRQNAKGLCSADDGLGQFNVSAMISASGPL
jgi:hypothetical protein